MCVKINSNFTTQDANQKDSRITFDINNTDSNVNGAMLTV